MGKVILYAIAAFMETGIGIWIFGQAFPKRECMEKRHVFGEWLLFAVMTACAYSFPNTFWGIANEQKYIRNLIILHLIIVLVYVITCLHRKQKKTKESAIIQRLLFAGMIVCVTAQFWNSYHSFSMAIAGYVYPVLFLWAFYKCSFIQAYLWEFTYCTNLGIIKTLYITYIGTFKQHSFEEFFEWPRHHTYIEVIFLLFIYCILLIINKYCPLKNFLFKLLSQNKLALFIFTFVEWRIFYVVINFGLGKVKEKNLMLSLFATIIIIFILILLYVRSMIKMSNAEKNFFYMRNQTIERQYHELNIAYEKYRCVIHDEKNMLLYLQECLEQNEIEKAKQFLNDYQGKLNGNGKQTWTGISTLDFLLNIKKQQMDMIAINFSLDCQIEKIQIKDTDFVALLGNLLDNAIEAVAKCPKEKRKIYLVLKNINDMFYLKLKNSCTGKPIQQNFKFLTNKKNKEDHGWGIESVKYIAQKYNGNISFQYSDNFFEVIVMI